MSSSNVGGASEIQHHSARATAARLAFEITLAVSTIAFVCFVALLRGPAPLSLHLPPAAAFSLVWCAAAVAAWIAWWGCINSRWVTSHRWRIASHVLSAATAAWIAPLTTVWLVIFLFGDPDDFPAWAIGIYVSGAPGYITWSVLVARRARCLATGVPASEPMPIYIKTVAMACIPFVLLVVPPIFVALTCLPLLPLLYCMEDWIRPIPPSELPAATARFTADHVHQT